MYVQMFTRIVTETRWPSLQRASSEVSGCMSVKHSMSIDQES